MSFYLLGSDTVFSVAQNIEKTLSAKYSQMNHNNRPNRLTSTIRLHQDLSFLRLLKILVNLRVMASMVNDPFGGTSKWCPLQRKTGIITEWCVCLRITFSLSFCGCRFTLGTKISLCRITLRNRAFKASV